MFDAYFTGLVLCSISVGVQSYEVGHPNCALVVRSKLRDM